MRKDWLETLVFILTIDIRDLPRFFKIKTDTTRTLKCSQGTPTRRSLYKDIVIPDTNIKLITDTDINKESNGLDSFSLVKGIFLYTDEDLEIVDYMIKNFEAFDELTGKWCCIYVLEKKGINWKRFVKYWRHLLLSELHSIFPLLRLLSQKPFNRNESYKIARDLGISSEQIPCIVFLPPLTKISGQDKLVVPIKEASAKYFRKIFSTLENIVNQAREQNNVNRDQSETKLQELLNLIFYQAIKVKFDDIIQYLEKNSEKVVQQTTTEYNINGTNIFVNSEIRRFNMTENNPNIKIDNANIGSVTGEGKIDTAILNQYNYPPEQKQNLAEAAAEIQQLLQQLSRPDYSSTPTENAIIVAEVMQEIEKNPSLKSRIIEALKQGGKEAFKELIDHPAINILIASIDGWNNAD